MGNWVVDLDGVMWRGGVPIAGSTDAVARLLDRGERVLFCTNNSMESGEVRSARLLDQGVPPGCDVITSADAVCDLVRPGERLLVLGGPGLREALIQHGAKAVDAGGAGTRDGSSGSFDAVVVGLTRGFDYRQLEAVAGAVRSGARLIASNTDATFPGADGIHPGCGALVAAVETASGTSAVAAGKPNAPMVSLVRRWLDEHDGTDQDLVVGDRPDTDGRLAHALGIRFGLVLSGVTELANQGDQVPVAEVAPDLATLVGRSDG